MSQNDIHNFSRRTFVGSTAALAASCFAGGQAARADEAASQAAGDSDFGQPFLTPAKEFRTVARGNPKPHTLTGDALVKARMTPETWRLEITADADVDPPHVKVPAQIDRPLTIEDGTALDYPALQKLGEQHGVAFIKAMQCLNIQTPLGQGLWEGVPLRDVLRLCGSMNNIRRIYYQGFHNNDPDQIFQSSLNYTQVMETPPGELPVFLAYRLNGEPIPPLRGGPVRMIVPWAHGFKSIKWLQHIFLTNDYRSNDTYSLNNNDPESYLKTAAYVEGRAAKVNAGDPVILTGLVINGLSGLKRVEYWVRRVDENSEKLHDLHPELLKAPWKPCELEPEPDWKSILPKGISPKKLLGFNPETGRPRSWPLRYGMATYRAVIRDLKPGKYELRARAVDLNGFAQPQPRPAQKTGKNSIQVKVVEVVQRMT
jgi:DMSO/TMAO reductase YedYZ molybdopterin-dependent catalytic subunit